MSDKIIGLIVLGVIAMGVIFQVPESVVEVVVPIVTGVCGFIAGDSFRKSKGV